MGDGWTQSLYFLPSISLPDGLMGVPKLPLPAAVFQRTTRLSHSGNGIEICHPMSPMNCVCTAAYSTVVIRALIENEKDLFWNGCCRWWPSARNSAFVNLRFSPTRRDIFIKEVSVILWQIGFFLICSIWCFLATSPVLSTTDIVNARNEIHYHYSHSLYGRVIATVKEAKAALLCLKWFEQT